MVGRIACRSRRPSRGVRIAAALLFLCAAPAAAQVGDTIPRPGADTVAAGAQAADQDTVPPPLVPLVSLDRPSARPGLWSGIWEWEHEEILRSRALDLADFLDDVPGITLVRSGFLGQPQAASAFGTGGGRLEVVLDGYELDPLDAASVDLSRIDITALRRVRVERRIDVLRIELETLAPTEREPYSRVEAATGDFDTELFRGVFLTPSLLGGPFGAAVSRLSTDGIDGLQPASTFGAWLRWGLVSESGKRGVFAELRRQSMDRSGEPFPLEGVRTDWVVRARSEVASGLVAEGFIGRSSLDDEHVPEVAEGDTAEVATRDESSLQGGVRALYETERFWARSALRARSGDGLPTGELEAAAGARLPGGLSADGDARVASWSGDDAAAVRLRLAWQPARWIRPFAEWATGTEGVPFLGDGAGGALTHRTALRAGTELTWRGVQLVGAGLSVDADEVAAFGLEFDDPLALYPGGEATGFEAGGRATLPWQPLWVEGWYSRWDDTNRWIYLPARQWRASLNLHWLPLESGNLEIFSRLEARDRGEMLVPVALGEAPVQTVPGIRSYDYYLQIRIIDVRAFIRWENMADERDLVDIPGLPLAPARVVYGVKWEFVN